MRVISASFVTSSAARSDGTGWPEDGAPEVAFAGRSNVGKSTLLSALMQRRGLVRTSATPGRTRLVNFFTAEAEPAPGERHVLSLVDLPGYGYAKVAKSEREKWLPFVDEYLSQRQSLQLLVMLVDPRRAPGLDETEIIKYVRRRGVQVLAAMTKADKLAKHERKPALEVVTRALSLPAVAVSATTGEGIDALWRRIGDAIGWKRAAR